MTPLPALAAMAALAKACVAVALAEVCYALVAAHTLAKACTLVAASVFLENGSERRSGGSHRSGRARCGGLARRDANTRRGQAADACAFATKAVRDPFFGFTVSNPLPGYCRVYKVGSLPINLKPTVASLCLHLDS